MRKPEECDVTNAKIKVLNVQYWEEYQIKCWLKLEVNKLCLILARGFLEEWVDPN
jgi:hypothetical protein